MLSRKLKGTLYGAVAAASYGTNPLFALPLYSAGLTVNSVLFYRYFSAVLIYFFVLKFVKRISLKISLKEFIPLLILAMLFSGSSLTLFNAFRYMDSGVACTILFIYPIIVALIMAFFFKEKITKSTISALILTSAGIILLYNGKLNESLNATGVLYILSSALFYALYIVAVKKIKGVSRIGSEKTAFYVMLFGLPIYIYNLKFCTQLQYIHNPLLWLNVIGLAIFPTIISIEATNAAIKFIGSTYTAILGALEPLTALFFGVLLFNEELTVRIIFGIAAILSGVIVIVIRNQNKCD